MDIKQRLGIKIRELRKEKGYSQIKLSSKCGLHRTYLSDIEKGIKNISIKNIEKINVSLDVEVKDLF